MLHDKNTKLIISRVKMHWWLLAVKNMVSGVINTRSVEPFSKEVKHQPLKKNKKKIAKFVLKGLYIFFSTIFPTLILLWSFHYNSVLEDCKLFNARPQLICLSNKSCEETFAEVNEWRMISFNVP